MAEIIARNSRGNQQKPSPKIDLTPMVDLGFLLLTFFVFTTTLSSTKAMNLVMPQDGHRKTNVPASGAVTIITCEHKLLMYEGAFTGDRQHIETIPYNEISKLRSKLLSIKQSLVQNNGNDDKMMVMIKPAASSRFSNVVDMLDEMTICNITRYALVDAEPAEENLTMETGN